MVAGRYENLPKPLRERGMRQAVMGESKRWQVFVPLGFRQALPSFGGAWRGLSFLIIHRLNSPIRRKKTQENYTVSEIMPIFAGERLK
ncbi:hypothetical protein DYJ25_10905 [Prevotella denticola]|nr:hypothetical protein DYJ25_10905 [Prevotella denticola]